MKRKDKKHGLCTLLDFFNNHTHIDAGKAANVKSSEINK
jgi:hypothetical protein